MSQPWERRPNEDSGVRQPRGVLATPSKGKPGAETEERREGTRGLVGAMEVQTWAPAPPTRRREEPCHQGSRATACRAILSPANPPARVFSAHGRDRRIPGERERAEEVVPR